MFERILIPLDGSSRAEIILAQLKPLLKREGTSLLLLKGVYAAPSMARIDTGRLAAEHTAEAESYLQHIVHRLSIDGIPSRAVIKKESPEDAILETAKELKCDLIAMTTHGRMGFERWMMGSVTEKVLRAAEVPMLIIHSFKRTPDGASIPLAGEPVRFKSILVPVDVGEQSLAILPWLEQLAKVYDAQIVVLHVKPGTPPDESGGRGTPPTLEPVPKAEIPIPPTVKIASERLAASGLKVRTLIVEGNPADQIRRVASTGEHDLIAMATHGRSGFRRWAMGSFAERILRSSPIPIFVVPSKYVGPS
jgi:nucleotide-binding universal stress UspA family protein